MIACGIMGPITIALMLMAMLAGAWTYWIIADPQPRWRIAVSAPLTLALAWLAMVLAAPLAGAC